MCWKSGVGGGGNGGKVETWHTMDGERIEFADATLHHPFTMTVSGFSGAGKSTFVSDLLENRRDYIDFGSSKKDFDYVFFMIGTSKAQNPLFESLAKSLKSDGVENSDVIDFKTLQKTYKATSSDVTECVEQVITQFHRNGKMGCLIIDDLMSEMGETNFLLHAFTVLSRHQNLTVINITHNIFYRGQKNNNLTIYRNTKYLVLFVSIPDQSITRFIVDKIGDGNKKKNARLREMITTVLKTHRYLLFSFDIETHEKLLFRTSMFQKKPLFKEVGINTNIPYSLQIELS